MLTFWSNCKLGVKLQSAFALVMLVFVAALVGLVVVIDDISIKQEHKAAKLLPAQTAATRAGAMFRTADDDGAYYIMDSDPRSALQRLTTYRADVAEMSTEMTTVTALANNDEQRKALADFNAFMNGATGYLQGNEQSFTQKAHGQKDLAEKAYIGSSPVPAGAALSRYIDSITA